MTVVMPRAGRCSRRARATYALSPSTASGRVRGRPSPHRAARRPAGNAGSPGKCPWPACTPADGGTYGYRPAGPGLRRSAPHSAASTPFPLVAEQPPQPRRPRPRSRQTGDFHTSSTRRARCPTTASRCRPNRKSDGGSGVRLAHTRVRRSTLIPGGSAVRGRLSAARCGLRREDPRHGRHDGRVLRSGDGCPSLDRPPRGQGGRRLLSGRLWLRSRSSWGPACADQLSGMHPACRSICRARPGWRD